MPVSPYTPFGQKTYDNPTVGLVLQTMCELAFQGHKDQGVRKLAESVVKDCQSGDYASYANAWNVWGSNAYLYIFDPSFVELTTYPEGFLREGNRRGDCDDQACANAAALESLGFDCYFVVVGFNTVMMPSHVFVGVSPRGKGPCVIDTVAKQSTPEMLRRVTFMRTVRVADGVDMSGEQVAGAYGLGMPFQGWGGWR